MKVPLMASLLVVLLEIQTGFAASPPPIPDIKGTILQIMLRPGSDGSKTAVRIYFSSVSGTDRFGCQADPGFVEITDDNARVSTARLNQMLTLALTAQTTGNTFGVDFQGMASNAETCTQGSFAFLIP